MHNANKTPENTTTQPPAVNQEENFSQETYKNNSKEAETAYLEKVKQVIQSNNPFAILTIEKTSTGQTNVNSIVKQISLKSIVSDILDFVAVSSLKQSNSPTNSMTKAKFIFVLLKKIAEDLHNSLKK